MVDEWGDVELDARGMRALAHPVRVAILERLRAGGPATATGLSPHVGATPSVTSWHLRHLAEHGLVEDAPVPRQGRERWWRAVGRGFRFHGPTDRATLGVMLDALAQAEGDQVQEWRRAALPRLEPEWVEVSGRWNTRVRLTPAEVAELNDAIDTLLTPYVVRDQHEDKIPDGARHVRLLRHVMPAAADS